MSHNKKLQTMTGLALFTAIVVVLQLVGTFIKFGPFAISLVLIPIVVGAAIYGPMAGAYLGGVFGVVVLIGCITGGDPGGQVLFAANPFVTALLCIVKGGMAGLAAGAVYRAVSHKDASKTLLAAVGAAVVAPMVNTGIFTLAMVFIFRDILVAWAGGTSVVYYILTGMVGINFVLELAVNLVVSPAIVRIINAKQAA